MAKFKVGDIVKGISTNKYAITNTQMTKAEVIRLNPDDFHDTSIRILEHTNEYHVGHTFYVESKYLALIEPAKKEKIIIYRNGDSVFAKDLDTKKVAEAKCSPRDKFDFGTGAKLALDRLIDKLREKKLRIVDPQVGSGYGVVGESTNYTDAVGRELHVGDVVEVFGLGGRQHDDAFIVRDRDKKFVMGCKASCDEENRSTGHFRVLLKKKIL